MHIRILSLSINIYTFVNKIKSVFEKIPSFIFLFNLELVYIYIYRERERERERENRPRV